MSNVLVVVAHPDDEGVNFDGIHGEPVGMGDRQPVSPDREPVGSI